MKEILRKFNKLFRKFCHFLLKEIFLTILLGGIVTSALVVFIGNRPNLKIGPNLELELFQESGRFHINFSLENTGKDIAKNITIKRAFIRDGESEAIVGTPDGIYRELYEGTSLYNTSETEHSKFLEKKDAPIIVLIRIEFNDRMEIRESFFNKILGKQYKIDQWCQYIEGHKDCYSPKKEQLDLYKEAITSNLDEWHKGGEIFLKKLNIP